MKIVEFSNSDPFNWKFWKENHIAQKPKFPKIWVYLASMSHFPEIRGNAVPFVTWNLRNRIFDWINSAPGFLKFKITRCLFDLDRGTPRKAANSAVDFISKRKITPSQSPSKAFLGCHCMSRSSLGALCDIPKNGCEGDYLLPDQERWVAPLYAG